MTKPLIKSDLASFLYKYADELTQSSPDFLTDGYVNLISNSARQVFPGKDISLLSSCQGGFITRDKGGSVADSSSRGEISDRSFLTIRDINQPDYTKLGIDLVAHRIYVYSQEYALSAVNLAANLERVTNSNFAIFSWNKDEMSIHNSCATLLIKNPGNAEGYKKDEAKGILAKERNVTIGNMQVNQEPKYSIHQSYNEYLDEQASRRVTLSPNEIKKRAAIVFQDVEQKYLKTHNVEASELKSGRKLLRKFLPKIEGYIAKCPNREEVYGISEMIIGLSLNPRTINHTGRIVRILSKLENSIQNA